MIRMIVWIGLVICSGIGLGILAFSQGVPVGCYPEHIACNDSNCTGVDCYRENCIYGIAISMKYDGQYENGCCNSTTGNYCCNLHKKLVKCKDATGNPCLNEVVFYESCTSAGLQNWTCGTASQPCEAP